MSTASGSRLQFIDLLRGAAVLVMIETHVVNALLRPDLKKETLFTVVTFVNGLVAPSFLFCAGLAFAISFHKKWRTYTAAERPLWRYLFRLLFIMVVAYSLHLPFFSLTRIKALPPGDPAWIPFYQTDILQTIAVSLAVMALLAVAVRQPGRFLWLTGALSLGLVFSAPIVRELDFAALPDWLRPYLTMRVKSQFPLFPWAAFVLTGMVTGWLYLDARKDGYERTFVKRGAAAAAAVIAIAAIAEALPFQVYPNHSFWRASPEFFFIRLGLIVLALAGFWLLGQRRTLGEKSIGVIFGQESLLVYVVHLLIVYGYTYEFSFIRYYGPNLNYLEVLPLVAGLIAAMYVLALVWHFLKGWNRNLAYFTEAVTFAVIIVMFLTKEG